MSSTFFSVITVARNAADTIEACIESVCGQTFGDIEYIVIDGASTDGTQDKIRRYRHRIMKYISEPDSGIYDAMNKGLVLASGKFVHFLNASDRYFNARVLEDIYRELEDEKVCYGDLIYVDTHGYERNLGRPFSWREELKASRIPQPVLFVPLRFYREVGGFDPKYRIAADYEMFLRLAKRYPVKYIPRPVTVMYAGGVSYRNPHLAFSEASEVAMKYGYPRPLAMLAYYWKLAKFFGARCLPHAVTGGIRR